MPTITVDKEDFFLKLGRSYSTAEFDALCFEFGIELDEDTSDAPRAMVDGVLERPQLKIEIPANRYDMLCFEGIARALNIFTGRCTLPEYTVLQPAHMEKLVVDESTSSIRQYVSAAILRNVAFDQARYDSFIALQDKLHANLCRNRTLVSMGTHDYDACQGPFTYEALPPSEIKFAPLNQTKEMNGTELMAFYASDKHLGRFLHIIQDSPVYPVVYDANRNVCSLPPIINSDRTKISPQSKNVFIEVTATDKTKVEIVINTLVAMFSEYCSHPFTVEPVEIVSPHNGQSRISPGLSMRHFSVKVDYLNSCTGLNLSADEICTLLKRMSYVSGCTADPGIIDVAAPCTRSDVLQECDIMEDVAIAYGYDNLQATFPDKSATIGVPSPINKLSDIVRIENAMCGWVEVMPLILCSKDENFIFMQRQDIQSAVTLANPKTAEYQVVRTSLVPGILKTIRENRKHALPIRVFEVSDVVFKDSECERKARNQRNWAAVYCGKLTGFEIVHGLLNRIFSMLNIKPTTANGKEAGYWIECKNHPTYFPGRAGAIIYRNHSGNICTAGNFGVLHPNVLAHFEIINPCSCIEVNLEHFV